MIKHFNGEGEYHCISTNCSLYRRL
jgi:hypothetical protein